MPTNTASFTPKEVFAASLRGGTSPKVLAGRHLNFVEAGLSRPAAVVAATFVALCAEVDGDWCGFTRAEFLERLHDEARRGILNTSGRLAFAVPESRRQALFDQGIDGCLRERLLRSVDLNGKTVLYPTTNIIRAYSYA